MGRRCQWFFFSILDRTRRHTVRCYNSLHLCLLSETECVWLVYAKGRLIIIKQKAAVHCRLSKTEVTFQMRNEYRLRLRLLKLLLGGMVFCTGTGCAEVVIRPNPAMIPQGRSAVYSDSDWALVLQNHVRNGLVDYDALAQNRENLDRYYALISVTGPTRTPEAFRSRPARAAYWINAYNALVLQAVLQRYPLVTMYDLSLPVLEYQYKFIVDGQVRHLAWIEEQILDESASDVRALFALSGAALGSPPLASEPIRPDTLERQLARAASRALEDPHICQVDHAARSILIWQKILTRRADFLKYWRLRRRVRAAYLFNVLLDMASVEGRRVLQAAVGYDFCEIPFDRKLNRYPSRSRVP